VAETDLLRGTEADSTRTPGERNFLPASRCARASLCVRQLPLYLLRRSLGSEVTVRRSRASDSSKSVMNPTTIPKLSPAPYQNPLSAYLAYKGTPDRFGGVGIVMPAGLQTHIWQPRLLHPCPSYQMCNLSDERTISLPALIIFYLYAMMRGTASTYRIAIATDESRVVRGFALVKEGDFRFPFMAPQDVQLGPVWTSPDYRGRGLATNLCRLALFEITGSAKNVWWLCRHENEPSKAIAKKLGLNVEGTLSRSSLLCLPAPHIYRLSHNPSKAPRRGNE
jgi:RimJ/RimL family protein N-acetyltransferase